MRHTYVSGLDLDGRCDATLNDPFGGKLRCGIDIADPIHKTEQKDNMSTHEGQEQGEIVILPADRAVAHEILATMPYDFNKPCHPTMHILGNGTRHNACARFAMIAARARVATEKRVQEEHKSIVIRVEDIEGKTHELITKLEEREEQIRELGKQLENSRIEIHKVKFCNTNQYNQIQSDRQSYETLGESLKNFKQLNKTQADLIRRGQKRIEELTYDAEQSHKKCVELIARQDGYKREIEALTRAAECVIKERDELRLRDRTTGDLKRACDRQAQEIERLSTFLSKYAKPAPSATPPYGYIECNNKCGRWTKQAEGYSLPCNACHIETQRGNRYARTIEQLNEAYGPDWTPPVATEQAEAESKPEPKEPRMNNNTADEVLQRPRYRLLNMFNRWDVYDILFDVLNLRDSEWKALK